VIPLDVLGKLSRAGDSKILLVVLDGLGGTCGGERNVTELEEAKTPHLDAIAVHSSLGLLEMVAPGITPGSGPGHLSLFGYDPLKYFIGRGVLSAAGVGLEMKAGDIAARINFCTVDSKGVVTDRRAGRIPTETCVSLCEKLNRELKVPGTTVVVKPEREHRAAVLFRGEGLDQRIGDTDPQREGLAPLPAKAASPEAEKAAGIVREFITQAGRILASDKPANMVLLRGFDSPPHLPQFPDVFKLKAACVAVYPMYRGISRLVGMDVAEFEGERIEDEVKCIESIWKNHDFIYLHVKKTDSYGEDGNRAGKVHVIEEFDALLPRLLALKPSVLAVTGDHSTPAALKAHSWHPSPVLLYAEGLCRPDGHKRFTESNCSRGCLGHLSATSLMPLMLAHALRLDKYGA